MTTADKSELAMLVAEGDLELVSLSDEQWDIVGLHDSEPPDAVAMVSVIPAIKSLVAGGLASVSEDGATELLGGAALLRDLRSQSGASFVVIDPTSTGSRVTTWSAVIGGVVMRHEWDFPGVHRFVLQSLPSAISELVAGLVPAGVADGEAFHYSSDDDQRLVALRTEYPKQRRLLSHGGSGAATDALLLHGGPAPGWVLRDAGAHASAEPVDRARLRLLARGVLRDAG